MHRLMQASARLISCDAAAESFWLTPAQADVLANEAGPAASPHFSVGERSAAQLRPC